jgi:hypothetical protein
MDLKGKKLPSKGPSQDYRHEISRRLWSQVGFERPAVGMTVASTKSRAVFAKPQRTGMLVRSNRFLRAANAGTFDGIVLSGIFAALLA